jgi:hypothetical protein
MGCASPGGTAPRWTRQAACPVHVLSSWPVAAVRHPNAMPPACMAKQRRHEGLPASARRTLSEMLSAMSRKVGRLGCRATCSFCTGVSRL